MDKEYNQYSQYDFITEEWPDIKKLVSHMVFEEMNTLRND